MIIFCTFENNQKYTCSVTEQDVPVDEVAFEFVGMNRHDEGKSNDDVVKLSFEYCSLSQIPHGIDDTFKNITELSIDHSKLQTVTKFDLRQFNMLKELRLTSNQIEFLPGDLFEYTKHLEAISFYSGKIKFIGSKLLDDLPNLKTAEFRENVNINFVSKNVTELKELKKNFKEECKPPTDDDDEMLKQYGRDTEKYYDLVKISFTNDLKQFLAVDDFKDFTIKVADKEFKVHKIIFAVRSQTFAELIKNNPEAEDLVLQDISVEVFECILSFIYTDELPETENALEVFAAAGKLKIRGLMNRTANYLMSTIIHEKNLEVLYKILCSANKYDYKILKLKTFAYIKKHFPNKILKNELANQPEKLKTLIEAKMFVEKQLEGLEI